MCSVNQKFDRGFERPAGVKCTMQNETYTIHRWPSEQSIFLWSTPTLTLELEIQRNHIYVSLEVNILKNVRTFEWEVSIKKVSCYVFSCVQTHKTCIMLRNRGYYRNKSSWVQNTLEYPVTASNISWSTMCKLRTRKLFIFSGSRPPARTLWEGWKSQLFSGRAIFEQHVSGRVAFGAVRVVESTLKPNVSTCA